jgi:hypothetical protein
LGHEAFVARLGSDGGIVFSAVLGTDISNASSNYRVVSRADNTAGVVGQGTLSEGLHEFNPLQARGGYEDVIVAAWDPNGALQLSSYIGGSDREYLHRAWLDALGALVICGVTSSSDLPLTLPAQPSLGGASDIFVVRLLVGSDEIPSSAPTK